MSFSGCYLHVTVHILQRHPPITSRPRRRVYARQLIVIGACRAAECTTWCEQ